MPLSTISRYRPARPRTCSTTSSGGRAAAAAAHERNDAERAAVIAAILNLEVGARAIAGGVFHRRGEKIALREDIADMDVAVVGRVRLGQRHQLRDLRLVRVAHHPLDARHRGQFLRRALRIAAGHQDARRGILAMRRGGWCAARPHRPRQ